MVDSPLSRRSLIAVGAAGMAGLVVSACSADDPVPDEDAPGAPAGLTPDVAVATSALAEIRVVRTAVDRTLARFPESRARLLPPRADAPGPREVARRSGAGARGAVSHARAVRRAAPA